MQHGGPSIQRVHHPEVAGIHNAQCFSRMNSLDRTPRRINLKVVLVLPLRPRHRVTLLDDIDLVKDSPVRNRPQQLQILRVRPHQRLRRARRRFQQWTTDAARHGSPLDTGSLEARLMADEGEETTLVVGSWTYQGTGWLRDGDKALADAAREAGLEF